VRSGLILVLIVAAAYLAGRVAFDWLARRLLIVSGAEYLLLGILLGPQVLGVLDLPMVQGFAPVTLLALGWMGAIIGMRLYLPELVGVPGIVFRLAFVESLLTLAVVAGVGTLAMSWLFDLPPLQAAIPGVALGAIATASASAGIDVIRGMLSDDVPLVSQLHISATVNNFVAIIALGLLVSIVHAPIVVSSRALTPTEWAVITIGVGVVGGSLFHLFLGAERHVDRLFISLTGGIILVSGAAAYLRVSPIMATMFFAAILVNTSRSRAEIVDALVKVERPFYFVLLLFAGATWRPSTETWFSVVVLFLLSRAVGKIGGARLATRINGKLPELGPDWGYALLGQGGLALALALAYLYHDDAVLPNLVFTAAIASVLLTDVLSARLAGAIVRRQSLAAPPPNAAPLPPPAATAQPAEV
jgi:hypothetical protein